MLISNENSESPTRYFYKQLCKNELQDAMKLYSILYSAILQHQNVICIAWEATDENADKDILNRFLFMVLADYPELFYIIWENVSYYFNNDVVEIEFKYACSKLECRRLQKKIEKKVLCLSRVAKSFYKRDVIQQIKYLYTYLATNISYAGDKLKSVEEKEVCRIHSALGVLVDKSAVCDGVAKAFKLLLDELGIESGIAHREINKNMEYAHVWNVIVINGKELHADVTWESNMYSIRKYVSYEFFLLTEEEMQEKHQRKSSF